jgi:hypothetical protein
MTIRLRLGLYDLQWLLLLLVASLAGHYLPGSKVITWLWDVGWLSFILTSGMRETAEYETQLRPDPEQLTFRTDSELVKDVSSILTYKPLSAWTKVTEPLFAVQMAEMTLDSHLFWRFSEIFGWEPENTSTDYYDESAELYGAPKGFTPTDEQLVAMGLLGFKKFWLHEDLENSGKPGEKLYYTR